MYAEAYGAKGSRVDSADGLIPALEAAFTGDGVHLDALSRIFDPFEQAGGAGRGRLGLGLTISKAIVELHGGRIYASSAGVDHGAMFVIELPNVVLCSTEPLSIQHLRTTIDRLISQRGSAPVT